MRTVAIWGNSLVLSSIRASLERLDRFRLVRVDAGTPAGEKRFQALHPDAVIFDLALQRPESAAALCKAHPQVLLIGVDPEADHVLMFSGHTWNELTPDELVNVIERHGSGAARAAAASRGPGRR